MGGLGSTGIPPEHRRREARRRPEARRAPRRRSTARTRGEKAWGGRPAHPEAVGVDSEACGGRNRWRWCSECFGRGRGRRLGVGDQQLPGSIPSTETKRRWRRSSWRSPIYAGWPLPAVSLLGGGGFHIGLAARVPGRGEKGGEEGEQVEGRLFIRQGGARVQGRDGGGHGGKELVAPVPSLWRQGRC